MITISVALLLAIIAILLLRRPPAARRRADTFFVMLIALVLGVLIAPTSLGEGIEHFMNQLANGITRAFN